MAKPRVFVSSTYYDLKHIRATLHSFIESLGFEPILSEKGDVPYSPELPLDESCYREVANADILVLIIGGRYGARASNEENRDDEDFYAKFDSVTKKEYDAAVEQNIPIYIFIESSVYAEFRTFMKNQDSENIRYASVDSANIFRLIKDILAKPNNNPVKGFEKFADIELWLKDQWAGLFKELLHQDTNQEQLKNLSSQVSTLKEINTTLQKYLEQLLTGDTEGSNEIIQSERKRLSKIEIGNQLQQNELIKYLARTHGLMPNIVAETINSSGTVHQFLECLSQHSKIAAEKLSGLLIDRDRDNAWTDLNEIRRILNLEPLARP